SCKRSVFCKEYSNRNTAFVSRDSYGEPKKTSGGSKGHWSPGSRVTCRDAAGRSCRIPRDQPGAAFKNRAGRAGAYYGHACAPVAKIREEHRLDRPWRSNLKIRRAFVEVGTNPKKAVRQVSMLL